MDIGKTRRLHRIFNQDGKVVIVPMDHGVALGPISGILNMQETVDRLALGETDAILIHKGIAQNINTYNMGLIVHLNASTELSPDPDWKVKVCSVSQAVRLGADGVSIHINLGAPKENRMLTYLGKVSDKCETYGIPLLAMVYPRGPDIKNGHDVTLVKHAARVGAELGADIIKTNYTGSIDTFKEVIQSCPAPVVIAGGPKMDTCEDILQMVSDSIKAGGAGVAIGRNIFQNKNPTAMSKAISAIVHKGVSVEEGLKIAGGAK
ncbi:2-amino-3,7-dideoxy-D-threo-hept-6-ulosonate synthase [Candidatus Bathyarchaeota archaeon]|nr:2-amino-3,7-dideoxy-D-threo-hept-6-ulosonate synthase [Candidatus Bathyarchaeota archaeon]